MDIRKARLSLVPGWSMSGPLRGEAICPASNRLQQDTMAKGQIYHEEDGDRNIKLAQSGLECSKYRIYHSNDTT